MLVFSTFMLDARPAHAGECISGACRDTIRQVDTVWYVAAAHAHDPAASPKVQPVITSSLFVPKGTFSFGLTASYNEFDLGAASDDDGYKMLFSLLDGLDGNMITCGVAPYMSYFIADHTSVGLRFDYSKSSMQMNSAGLALGDLMSFDINDMYYMKQSYSGSLTLRHYMPIAESQRLALFLEGRGTYGYGQSKSYKFENGDKFGTYQDIYKYSLDIVPGIVCFIMDNAAFEVSVGVLGFNTQRIKQTTNQVEYSEMKSSAANFKVNLMSINLGTSFYIYPKKNRR